MLHDRSGATRPATVRRPGGPAVAAPALGALGAGLVVTAIVLSIADPLTVAGLAAASVGVVLTGAGLVLATISAVRGRTRCDRTAIAAAGISVAGLAGGLTWLAAFVLTAAVSGGPVGSVGLVPIEVEQPACVQRGGVGP